MVLVDDEIQLRAITDSLIVPFTSSSLINCRYNLRAGRAFSPDNGDEIALDRFVDGTCQVNWRIKPSETLMIMTTETVNIPGDLLATYGQLNHLAQQGLLLVNSSIVEPGYSGHLSCFLINFSKQTIDISPGQEIAKLCFYKLTKEPVNLKRFTSSENTYRQELSKAAARYPTSFLDIGGIEKRVTRSVTEGVSSSIKWGTGIIVFLVFFSSLEPLLSKYVFERIGISTATTSQDVLKLRNDMIQAKNDIASAKNNASLVTSITDETKQRTDREKELTQRITQLEHDVKALQKNVP